MVFSFTVTGTEFRNRFPLYTWSLTDARVEGLYNGLYDRDGGSYWTNVIWNSGANASARSAAAYLNSWVE